MPSFKVVYFDARGRAEVIRLMLAYVGEEFEDVRIKMDDWPKCKPEHNDLSAQEVGTFQKDAPMQQLPYLEVDGKRIPQSRAMHGFVARKFGINGANNEETTKIEIIIATLEDIRDPLSRIMFYEKDEEKKKKDITDFYANKVPTLLTALEEFLKINKGGDGFFVGDKISRADIVFYAALEVMGREDILKIYPKLFALKKRIENDPKIAAYLAKRPKTQY